MTELEKLKAGLEYCYDDAEVEALKLNAIRECKAYNSIDDEDYAAQSAQLKKMLGGVGEKVWIAKTFNCDNGKNIFIGSNFTGNYNLTILDIQSQCKHCSTSFLRKLAESKREFCETKLGKLA